MKSAHVPSRPTLMKRTGFAKGLKKRFSIKQSRKSSPGPTCLTGGVLFSRRMHGTLVLLGSLRPAWWNVLSVRHFSLPSTVQKGKGLGEAQKRFICTKD